MRLSEAEAQVEGVVGRGGAVVLEALGYRLPGVLDGPVIPALAQRRRCREGGEVKCADMVIWVFSIWICALIEKNVNLIKIAAFNCL